MKEKLYSREWFVIAIVLSFIGAMALVTSLKRRSVEGLLHHYQTLEKARGT
ncbi:MAG: hypothetical protein JSR76_00745 [Verrucomicrobia bacterium]|nr:hypothetical protein [Verrucomicrobiota bacterium]